MTKVVDKRFLSLALTVVLTLSLLMPVAFASPPPGQSLGATGSASSSAGSNNGGGEPRLQTKIAPDLDKTIRGAAMRNTGNGRQRVIVQLRDLTSPQQEIALQGMSEAMRKEFF